MKLTLINSIRLFPLLMLLLIVGCQKEDGINTQVLDSPISVRTICGQVNYTAPTTVNVDDPFNIQALISCGRVALERGFVMVGTLKVYNGVTCETPGLMWEDVVSFQCYTTDLSYTTALSIPGTYAYRTKHNMNDGNCDNLGGSNTSGNCSGFTGNQFCCFSIEVIEACDIQPGDFTTFSQGFYLNSQNGADFLNAHPELGPVNVGCAGGTTTSWSLASIIALSPGNSTPPGNLVKQIITMMLNVAAQAILNPGNDLGCLVVVADGNPATTLDDSFAGMTVNEIIQEANNYVGGCGSTFTSGELTNILDAIVQNFHELEDGTLVNLGLLTCCE